MTDALGTLFKKKGIERLGKLDIRHWYKANFDCDYSFRTIKDLTYFTEDELKIVISDYVYYILDSFVAGVVDSIEDIPCAYAYIDMAYDICNELLVEEVSNITKKLFKRYE